MFPYQTETCWVKLKEMRCYLETKNFLTRYHKCKNKGSNLQREPHKNSSHWAVSIKSITSNHKLEI